MAIIQPNIAEFRNLPRSGHGMVRDQLRRTPGDTSMRNAVHVYRRMFGIIDAMTAVERASPFAEIDSGRIRRIARGAGTTDQEVIQWLFCYRDFCETWLRGQVE